VIIISFPAPELDEKLAEMVSACACLNTRKASRAITQIFDEELRPSGIRATQFPDLVTLSSDPSTTIASLAECLIMDRTSVTRLLKPLQESGLICVSKGKDKRSRVLSLSARGRQAVLDTIPLWEIAQTRVIDRLGESDWNLLKAGLQAISAKIGKK